MDPIQLTKEAFLQQKLDQINEQKTAYLNQMDAEKQNIEYYNKQGAVQINEQVEILRESILSQFPSPNEVFQLPAPTFELKTEAELSGMRKSQRKAYQARVKEYEEQCRLLVMDHAAQLAERERQLAEVRQLKETCLNEMREQKQKSEAKVKTLEGKESFLDKKERILSHPEAVDALFSLKQEQNAEERKKKAEAFLRLCAKLLSEDEKHGEQVKATNMPTADLLKSVDAYKIAAAEQADEAVQDDIYEMLSQWEERFNESDQEYFVAKTADFELRNIFADEFGEIPELGEVTEEMSEKMGQLREDVTESFCESEQSLPELFRIPVTTDDERFMTGADGALKAYSKSKYIDEFRTKVKNLMESRKLDKKSAEKLVLADMRKALHAKCEDISYQTNVQGEYCSKEAMKESGGVSRHKVLTISEALRVEKESGGFLVAIPYGTDGKLMELRPSIPETVKINGKEVPLRKTYNYIIKAAISSLFGEDGKLLSKKDLLDNIPGTRDSLTDHINNVLGWMMEYDEASMKAGLEVLRPALEKSLAGKYAGQPDAEAKIKEEADSIMADWMQIASCSLRSITSTDEVALDTMLKPFFNYQGADWQKLKQIGMGMEGATEEEVDKAIEEIKADQQKAVDEMAKIKDMDAEGKLVPLPNTCSANAKFVQNMKASYFGKIDNYLQYHYDNSMPESNLRTNVEKNLEYMLKNFDTFAVSDGASEAFLKSLPATKEKFTSFLKQIKDGHELTKEQMDEYVRFASRFLRYDWHVSSPIYSKQEKGKRVTYVTETFARMPDQIVAPPFTLSGCVGTYKEDGIVEKEQNEKKYGTGVATTEAEKASRLEGLQEKSEQTDNAGMKKYYDNDNPFAYSKVKMIKSRLVKEIR